jgi:hypothetical protein
MTKSNFRILRPFVTVLAMVGAVALSGCSGGGPKKAAQNYVDNLKLFKDPACYQTLSHQDQIDQTLDDWTKLNAPPSKTLASHRHDATIIYTGNLASLFPIE